MPIFTIKRTCKIKSVDEWQKVTINSRDNYLRSLKQEGLSVRQIFKLAGLKETFRYVAGEYGPIKIS